MENNRFKNYTTSTAFSISLSRAMIETLCLLEQYGSYYVTRHSFSSLYNRGLIELDGVASSDLPDTIKTQLSPCVKLTEAGKAIIPLLKLSGLYIEYTMAIEIPSPTLTLKGR